MADPKNIIEEYKKADFEKRLYLFLDCRSLRNQFIEIDQNDAQAKLNIGCSQKAKLHKSPLWRALSAALSFNLT